MDFSSWSWLARNLVPVIFFPFKLNLRLKALKRQMDEAEEEIDRLEHSKKKLQRDLDEQQEANEQLQSQLKALKTEIRSTIQNQKRITALEKTEWSRLDHLSEPLVCLPGARAAQPRC